MTLGTALSTAVAGLQTAQQRIAIASNNVANANTEGYSRKIAGQEAVVLAGQGTGSQVSDVYRVVDEAMQKQLRQERGDLGRDDARREFYQQMQQMFGTPEANTSITARITDLADALDALAADPEQNAPRLHVLDNAREVIQGFEDMSDQIQDLRASAEAKIDTAVDEVNNSLTRIQQLNTDIVALKLSNQPTTELEDKRDLELETISKHMNISTFTRSQGDVVIYTGNGSRTLLDRTANTLDYQASTTFVAGSGGNRLQLNGVDITDEIRTGSMQALFDLRDSELPQLQDQMDELAVKLRDEVNAVHNKGTSFPPPENLYSSRQVATNDLFTGAGYVRIAAVGSNGNISAKADIDLATVSTVGEVITAINAAFPGGEINAQIVNGQLQLEGRSGNRVSINELDSEVAFQQSGEIVSRETFAAVTDTMAQNGSFDLTANGGAPVTVSYTAGQTVQDVIDEINTQIGAGAASFANGKIVVNSPAVVPNQGVQVTYRNTQDEATSQVSFTRETDTRGFSHYFGLNDMFQTSNRSSILYSDPVDDPDAALGAAGTLRIGTTDITYTTTDSLNDVATAINAAAGGFSARVFSDGDRSRLELTGTGDANLFYHDTPATSTSSTLVDVLDLNEDGAGISAEIFINPQINADAQRIAYAELNADNYETANGTFTETGQITVGGNVLGTGTLEIRGPFGIVDIAYGAGTAASPNTLEGLADAINADADLTDAGISAEVYFDSTGGGYKLRVEDSGGDPFTINEGAGTVGNGFVALMGLDTQFGVQSGDNTVAQKLAARFDDTDVVFDASGGLTGETTSFVDFSAAILSANATAAADADADYEFQNTLVLQLETNSRNLSAVNIDEEMSDLIIFENAYSAAARVITTVNQMFDELLQVV